MNGIHYFGTFGLMPALFLATVGQCAEQSTENLFEQPLPLGFDGIEGRILALPWAMLDAAKKDQHRRLSEIGRQNDLLSKRLKDAKRCLKKGGRVYARNETKEEVEIVLTSWIDEDGNANKGHKIWTFASGRTASLLSGGEPLIVQKIRKYTLKTKHVSRNFTVEDDVFWRDGFCIPITDEKIERDDKQNTKRQMGGPVEVHNETDENVKLSIADFYLDEEDEQVASTAYWRLKPGERVYLLMDGRRLIASELRYRLTTGGGSTPRYNKFWSDKCKYGSVELTIEPDNVIATRASSSLSSKSKSSPPPRPSPPPASSLPGAYVQSKNARVYENSSGLWYIVLSAQIKIRRSGTYKVRGGFVDRSGDFMRNSTFGTKHVDRTIRGDAGDTISVSMELRQRPGGTWSVEIVDD